MRRSACAIRRAPDPCGGSARVAWPPAKALAVASCGTSPLVRQPLLCGRCYAVSTVGLRSGAKVWEWSKRMAIPRRELGRTGLQVRVLGYGAMELRGAPRARDITEAQAETILNAALDAGINYIDTSIDYGLSRTASAATFRSAARTLSKRCHT